MTKIESNSTGIQASANEVWNYLSDFNNFGNLMPPQIMNWKSTSETCSFTIQNMASLSMRIKEKTAPVQLVIVSEKPSPFPFELICNLEAISDTSCSSKIQFHAEMNPILTMMAQKPLQNFVNMLNEQLRKTFE